MVLDKTFKVLILEVIIQFRGKEYYFKSIPGCIGNVLFQKEIIEHSPPPPLSDLKSVGWIFFEL